MWLIDYFKKNKTVSAVESADHPDTLSKEQPSVFKGDLAGFWENSDSSKAHAETDTEQTPADSDPTDKKKSLDCEIFMTFSDQATEVWSCPECGTHNEKQMTDCVVCGLKK